MNIVILGAGLMGRLLACQLARAGHQLELFGLLNKVPKKVELPDSNINIIKDVRHIYYYTP